MTRAEKILSDIEEEKERITKGPHSSFIRGSGYTGTERVGSGPKGKGRIVKGPDGGMRVIPSRRFGKKAKK